MGKTAFLFPGQGSQYAGMGKSLCEISSAAREVFKEANDSLEFDIRKLCFEGGMEELTKTENTQPAILTVSVAAYRVFMEKIGIKPEFTAGHSLGEYSALCCSGAVKFADAVRIVKRRGRFMQEAVAAGIGSMAAVSGASRKEVEEECARISRAGRLVVVSNYNSPEQIVISGYADAVAAAAENLEHKGARVIPLKVSAPFHSPLMQPAADRLREELHHYTYSAPAYQVISNVTALPHTDTDKIIENLSRQIVQPVRWTDSMAYLVKQDVDLAIEMGPQTVLKNLMKKNAPEVRTFSFEKEEDLSALNRQFSNREGKDAAYGAKGLALLTKCIAIAVCTKNHNWNNEEYQKGVVEPYNRIKAMKDELEKEKGQPTPGQMKEALELLRKIFVTKITPAPEQAERFQEIFDSTGTGQLFRDFEIPA